MDIQYNVNQAGLGEIAMHLTHCDKYFSPPLSTRVNIYAYAEKLLANAERLEAWEHDQLIGLVAVYMNNPLIESAFITNVSVLPEFGGRGIAPRLIEQGVRKAKEKGFKKVSLEVSAANLVAVALYKKMNFISEEQVKSNMLTMTKYL